MEFNKRRTVNDDMKKYDPSAKEDSFIEISEWYNGIGVDVTIDNKSISLTYDELDAINYLIKALMYENK